MLDHDLTLAILHHFFVFALFGVPCLRNAPGGGL